MSTLPVPVRDFTSLMKTLFSPSGDNRSATMNETPDVEQARHQELDHGHCQQQQCRGDEGTENIICQRHPIMLKTTKVAAVMLLLLQNPSPLAVLPDLYPAQVDLQ